jgi:hypothetical protein
MNDSTSLSTPLALPPAALNHAGQDRIARRPDVLPFDCVVLPLR